MLTKTKTLRFSSLGDLALADKGNQHGHRAAILLVSISVFANQISLLKLNCQQDIGCSRDREKQVRQGHHRSHPESKKPADVERVAHQPVWPGGRKPQHVIRLVQQIPPDLSQSE